VTLGQGLEIRPIRKSRARSGPGPGPAFDCRQVKLEQDGLSLVRQSATALLLRLADNLVEPPLSVNDETERIQSLASVSVELYHRGFDVELLVKEAIVPLMAAMTCTAATIAIVAGKKLSADWRYHSRTGWTDLLLEAGEPSEELLATPDAGGPALAGPVVARIITDGLQKVTRWMDGLSLDELFRWRTPSAEEYQQLSGTVHEQRHGVHWWIFQHFTVTYLESWATESLKHEWLYLHGDLAPPCNPSQMASRRIEKNHLACVLADRVTSSKLLQNSDDLVIGKYVGVAADLLAKGDRVAAFTLFDIACGLSPDSGTAHNNRGFCRLHDDPSEALTDFERARNLGTLDPFVTVGNQMLALHKLGHNASALKVAADAWTWNRDFATGATMWDFRTDEPTLLEVQNSLLYLAELAETIADRSGDESGAIVWHSRVEEYRIALTRTQARGRSRRG
jgi:hypothetical protein